MSIVKEEVGYSANTIIGNHFIATEGETLEELKTMVLEAVNLAFENEGYIYAIHELD
ncbi:putative phage-related endonuclease [Pedobacter sp. UYP30]|uniref:hypothetical protein n=1 Tax=Pedobacter sp. UYP30 TaxID=1756400 RepID=UPI003398233D